MIPRYNLWIESDGQVVLSGWRVRLLEAIDRTGSIRSAAEQLNVPYRRAWEKVQEMESRSGSDLVKTEVGGEGGGGAHLTDEARDLVRRFARFEEGLQGEIERRYAESFGGRSGAEG
jgi:molybdate transport system regulatory protein